MLSICSICMLWPFVRSWVWPLGLMLEWLSVMLLSMFSDLQTNYYKNGIKYSESFIFIVSNTLQAMFCWGTPFQKTNDSLPLDPVLVVGDVLSVEQLVWGRVFAQLVFWRRTWVHEGLSYYRQTRVCDAVLMDVKDKLRILYHIHPEPQWQTAEMESEYGIKRRDRDKVLYTAHHHILVMGPF